ncbi:hypothetical protein F511_38359 [Dorcoceras hygrometricum]|uniref:Uncharacterized protein n=1 Tax=Dorcoceras hygrometricum TaxID=472368 RepID=A0A2Z7BUE2_9LAMI|nr:hypothetical protein F511_38359 [Dorcoceras hygrometricum]
MASSLISNSHHIDFDSVFDMDDAGLAQSVFRIKGTSKHLLSEKGIEDSISAIARYSSDTLFVKAGSFDAVTRDRFLLMMAITFDVKVNWSNLLFGVLQAMVTPGSRQAKGFAIQIGVLLQNVQGLVLGESKGFPKSRILDAKTVHRFVHINEKVGLDESAASPRKKRTTKGKPVVIAQEAVPPKIDDATTVEKTVADPDPVSGGAWLQPESQGEWLFTVGGCRLRLIKSTTGSKVPSSAYTRRPDEINTDGNSSKSWPEQIPARGGVGDGGAGGGDVRERRRRRLLKIGG